MYYKHGLARHNLYDTWLKMIKRCYDSNCHNYKNYGARGIIVCERWKNNINNFIDDMGEKPSSKHSLNRIDNNGNYEPYNCKWSTIKEQSNNKRSNCLVLFNGKKQTLKQWTDELGLKNGLLADRINRSGWSIEKALTEPVRKWNKK